MERTILENINKYKLINKGDNIVIGVSGGHDSMALLYILNNLKDELECRLIVCHINHDIRGKFADRDEKFVKSEARKLGLDFYSKKESMEGLAKKEKISDEEAGRKIRYNFFNEILTKYNGGKIAVAHNRNDQSETILMRIIRGTGIDGLSGMSFKNGNIIRPLLNIDRNSIESYIDNNNIDVVIDHTNKESIYTRNKIRLDLIPYIEENFNNNFQESLYRLGETSREEVEFLEDYTNKQFNKCLLLKNKKKIKISRNEFIKNSKNIQSRIIRKGIGCLTKNLKDLGKIHIDDILVLINDNESGRKIDLPNGIFVLNLYNEFIISTDKNILKKEENYIEELSLGLNEFKNLGFAFNLYNKNENNKNITDDMRIKVDLDKINNKIYVRNRRDGDRFIPLGMKGRKKIKDYFIDAKVPRVERDKIPIVVDGNDIIWVVGHRLDDRYKITKDTENILVIEYIKKNNKNKECNNG